MATFSVDGISSLREEVAANGAQQQSITAQIKEKEKEKERIVKQQNKIMETTSKKMVAEKEKMSKMQEQRIMRLIQIKIGRRFDKFPWLKEKIPALSSKPNLAELEETDQAQKLELNCQDAEKRCKFYLQQGSTVLESFWGDGKRMTFLPDRLRFDLRHLADTVNSPVFMNDAQPLIDETVIEYPELFDRNLAMRWIECLLTTMATVDMYNRNPKLRELLQKRALQAAQPEIQDDDEQTEEDK